MKPIRVKSPVRLNNPITRSVSDCMFLNLSSSLLGSCVEDCLLLVLTVDVVDLVDPDVGVGHPEAHCLSPELGVAVEGHKLARDVRVNYLKR